jgi:putative hydrolase of the HAD superfamily
VPANAADVLLFDLGGVVIDVDFNRAFARWAEHAGCDPARFRERFRPGAGYQRHERGEIDAAAYFADLRASFDIELSDAQLPDGWNAIFIGAVPGMADVLARAARRFPLYGFTNTNPTHQACWSRRFPGILGHFREIYVSSMIGLRKPEAGAYDYVVESIGVPADRILFFDDSPANVAGARARGLQAVRVRSIADVEDALA